MFKSEESKVAIIGLTAYVIILIAARTSDTVALITLGAVILIAALTWGIVVKRQKLEKRDERSGHCSLVATRNAFLVAIAMIAVYVAAQWFTVTLASTTDVLTVIWGVAVGVYLFTYRYVKNKPEREV